MDESYYLVLHCTFCGADLSNELEDEIEWEEDD